MADETKKYLSSAGVTYLWKKIATLVKATDDIAKANQTKLAGITAGANKVEATTHTDGNKSAIISIDGVSKTLYTHPASSAAMADANKVTIDAQGHVTAASKETGLRGLGIAASDTAADSTAGTVTIAGTTITIPGVGDNKINLASNVEGVLAVANGGTGANDAAGAKANLGFTTLSEVQSSAINFTSSLKKANVDVATVNDIATAKSAILGQTEGADYAGTVKGAYEAAATASAAAATADAKAVTAQGTADKVTTLVGSLPTDATATTVVGYVDAKVSAAKTDILGEAGYAGTVKGAYAEAASKASAAETAAKAYADTLLSDYTTGSFLVVSSLPATSAAKTGVIYLVAEDGGLSGTYVEYIKVNKGTEESPSYALERIGTTAADVANKVDKIEGKGLSTNDYDNSAVANLASAVAFVNKHAATEAGAEINKINVVKVNGSALTITASDRSVNVTAVTGIKVGSATTASTGEVTLGAAAAKGVATALSATSTDNDLATAKAVVDYVKSVDEAIGALTNTEIDEAIAAATATA